MRLARSTTAVALALVLLTPAIPAAAAPASVPARPAQSRASARKAVPGRLIVKFKGAITADKLGRVYRSADTSAGAVSALRGDVLLWKTPRGTSDSQFAKALSASGEIEYAVPDYIRQPTGYVPPTYVAPNDPDYNEATAYTESKDLYAYGRSWWLREMNAASAWSTGYTGSPVTGKYPLRAAPASITVGVLDTGTWMTHPDLQANVVAGWDFFDHEDASFNLIQDGNVTPTSPASTAPPPL